MLIRIFDIVVILLLIFINIKFWNKKWGSLVQILGTLLYVFVLPIISMKIEAEIISRKYEIVDGFNFLYAFFRFPLYWILYFLQLIIYHKKDKRNSP